MSLKSSSEAFWDLIDAVLVINMPNRSDRWQLFTEMVSTFIPSEKLHRIEAVVGTNLPGYKEKPFFTDKTPESVAKMKAGAAGCCLSHRKAIEYAKSNGWKRVLVMEDDALFLSDFKGPVSKAVASIISRQDGSWSMFYLGFYQRVQKHYTFEKITEGENDYEIMRIRGPLMAHAIIFSHDIYDLYLKGLPTEKNLWEWMTYWGSIDSWIHNKFGRQKNIRIWGVHPNIVVQRVGFSDIVGHVLSEEEVTGTHRKRKIIPYDTLEQFEKTVNLSVAEILYQGYKRSMRVLKAKIFGYKKT